MGMGWGLAGNRGVFACVRVCVRSHACVYLRGGVCDCVYGCVCVCVCVCSTGVAADVGGRRGCWESRQHGLQWAGLSHVTHAAVAPHRGSPVCTPIGTHAHTALAPFTTHAHMHANRHTRALTHGHTILLFLGDLDTRDAHEFGAGKCEGGGVEVSGCTHASLAPCAAQEVPSLCSPKLNPPPSSARPRAYALMHTHTHSLPLTPTCSGVLCARCCVARMAPCLISSLVGECICKYTHVCMRTSACAHKHAMPPQIAHTALPHALPQIP